MDEILPHTQPPIYQGRYCLLPEANYTSMGTTRVSPRCSTILDLCHRPAGHMYRHPHQVQQFANDAAVIKTHQHKENTEEHLQTAISAAATWLKQRHLLFNTTKTMIMSFSPEHQLKKLRSPSINEWHSTPASYPT